MIRRRPTRLCALFAIGVGIGLYAPPRAQGATMAVTSSAGLPAIYDSGVAARVSDELGSIFDAAAERLRKIVLDPPGALPSSQDFYRSRAAQLLNQVEQEVHRLKLASSSWVGRNVPAAYVRGISDGLRMLVEAGVVRPEEAEAARPTGSFTGLNTRTLQRIALDTVQNLGRAADAMGHRAATTLRKVSAAGITNQQVNDLVARGIISGEGGRNNAAARELRDALRQIHGKTVPIVDKNGDIINFDAGKYASMVVRTRTREATVGGILDRMQASGQDLVTIVGRISKHFCTAYLGRVYSISGKSTKYPPLSSLPGYGEGGEVPPFHPNCTKGLRPFIERLATPSQLKHAAGHEPEMHGAGSDGAKLTTAEAQRRFQDGQLYNQVKARYGATSKPIYGVAATGKGKPSAGSDTK
jgi:hypothetical protein